MNEEIKKDRSRNYPKLSLAASVELAKKLYSKAGKAKISSEVAVGALGYSGLNGAALAALGTLTHYGLIDRERGKSVSISPLAIKLIHPLNSEQEIASKRESALLPQVFKELFDAGFHRCDTDLIANHLIQNEFTPEGARRAANIFKENIELAKLQDSSINTSGESEHEDKINNAEAEQNGETPFVKPPSIVPPKGKTVLATYSIPLGSNEATITFTGDKLSVEDFEVLKEYADIWKRQFERKQKAESSSPIPPKPNFPETPFVAQRKTATGETMVKIIGQAWCENGKWVCQADGGLVVPVDEIIQNLKA